MAVAAAQGIRRVKKRQNPNQSMKLKTYNFSPWQFFKRLAWRLKTGRLVGSQPVKIVVPCLIGGEARQPGEVVVVSAQLAASLINTKTAEPNL